MSPVLGQEAAWNHLRHCLRSDRLVHAWLFWGEEGLGASTLAYSWVQMLFCEADVEDRPCGQCDGCRKLQTANHPDFLHISPDGQSIKLEQTKAIQQWISMRPIESRYRVCLMEHADRMTPEAANSLLKSIEDPSNDIIFVLTSENLDRILPTIRSRCRSIRLTPVAFQELAHSLVKEHSMSHEAAMELARLANGNPGQAERFLEGDFTDLRQEVDETLDRIEELQLEELFQRAEKWSDDQEKALRILDLLEWRFYLERPAHTWKVWQVEEARRQMMMKANRRLVFDVLLLHLKQGVCKDYNDYVD